MEKKTKTLRNERNRLYRESCLLRQAAIDEDNKHRSFELRKKQQVVYNKWKYYDNFIKAQDKIKKY